MTATQRADTGRRYRGVVYGIDVLDHASVMADAPAIVPNDYIGQTRQRGRGRENQHRDKQPFSDVIVGSPRVLWEGLCTDAELDEMERHFIQQGVDGVRPRLNEIMNEDNPHMIPKGVQKAQRWARDDKAGEPRWQPADRRDRSSLLEWDTGIPSQRRPPRAPAPRPRPRQRVVTRSWGAVQVRAGLWCGSWALLWIAGWAGLTRYGITPDLHTRAITAAVVATGLLVWGVWRQPDTWPMWRRRLRKARRWLR